LAFNGRNLGINSHLAATPRRTPSFDAPFGLTVGPGAKKLNLGQKIIVNSPRAKTPFVLEFPLKMV
jgi:hypothetical protein